MRSEVIERLLNINREFYQSFAEPFRSTRGRLQPGVMHALETVGLDADVLDLGCAHGVLAGELAGRDFSGNYVGLDSSQPLLDSVAEHLHPPRYQFALADLGEEEWPETALTLLSKGLDSEQGITESSIPFDSVSESPASEQRVVNGSTSFDSVSKVPASARSAAKNSIRFDWVLAFAVLHHLPSSDLRKSTAAAIGSLLKPGGRVAVSVWDFLASPRLRDRIVPWETVDLGEDEVDEGDYLVDWREGGSGVRYVHHFSQSEFHKLAEEAGFQLSQEYRSDGENGRLGLYQIWEIA